jgi:hypothetical protein
MRMFFMEEDGRLNDLELWAETDPRRPETPSLYGFYETAVIGIIWLF